MKYFTLLIFPFLLLSCGTETSVDEPETETVRIGSFDVVTNLETNETHAEWVGTPSKMKSVDSDTSWFSSPDGHSITLYEGFEGEEITGFYLVYIDSSRTDWADIDDWGIKNPLDTVGGTLGNGFDHNFLRISTSHTEYDCNAENEFPEDEAIEFYTVVDDHRQVYVFNVNGMIESIELVACH